MLVSGPLKALGWFLVLLGFAGLFLVDKTAGGIAAIVVGGVLVWVGRWVSAAREARLQRKWERHYDRADQIRGRTD